MKKTKTIVLSKAKMRAEHKKLIPMLEKAGEKKEAKEQKKEMKKYE